MFVGVGQPVLCNSVCQGLLLAVCGADVNLVAHTLSLCIFFHEQSVILSRLAKNTQYCLQTNIKQKTVNYWLFFCKWFHTTDPLSAEVFSFLILSRMVRTQQEKSVKFKFMLGKHCWIFISGSHSFQGPPKSGAFHEFLVAVVTLHIWPLLSRCRSLCLADMADSCYICFTSVSNASVMHWYWEEVKRVTDDRVAAFFAV